MNFLEQHFSNVSVQEGHFERQLEHNARVPHPVGLGVLAVGISLILLLPRLHVAEQCPSPRVSTWPESM